MPSKSCLSKAKHCQHSHTCFSILPEIHWHLNYEPDAFSTIIQLTFYIFLVIKIYINSLLYLNYEDNHGRIYYANVCLFHRFNLRLDKFSYKNYQLIFHFSKMSKMQVNIVYFGKLYMYVCAGGGRGWQTYPKSWPKKKRKKKHLVRWLGRGCNSESFQL